MLNKIIDNKRKSLLQNLLDTAKDFDELSIATGYWDLEGTLLVIDQLKKYKKIRLIIGREPLLKRDNAENKNGPEIDFPDADIFADLENLPIRTDLKETVAKLRDLITDGVLEVRVYRRSFLHAKCYIFGNYKTEKAVGIIGSSNFTRNGLTTNLELNAGENDNRIVQFTPQSEIQEHGHMSWFDEVWSDDMCEDWTGKFIELVDGSVHGDLLYSPYEMYIKTLEYVYGEELEIDRDIEQLSGKTLQAFQERNIQQLMHRLEKYGVAMLADSVGLGKTVSAIGVIKQYRAQGRIVIIAPASLVTQWNSELAQEGLFNMKAISLQDIGGLEEEMKIDKHAPVNLFVIDEAHNLRSHSSTRYQKLYEWIDQNEDAHTLLLTATPINNSLSDLTNQILLGTRGEQDILPVYTRNSEGILELKSFYETVENIKKRIAQNKAQGNDLAPILKEARATIEPIMRAFVVRNTRQGIEKEFGGIDIHGALVTFPKVRIKNISFDIDRVKLQAEDASIGLSQIAAHELEQLATFTEYLLHPKRQMSDIVTDASDGSLLELLYKAILSLSFVPYRYDMYNFDVYGKDFKAVMAAKMQGDFKKNLARQLSLYGILRTVFLKRLESSASALTTSLRKYEKRLGYFEQILTEQHKVISLSDISDIEDEYLEEDGEQIDWTDEKVMKAIAEKARDVSTETHDLVKMQEDIIYEKEILAEIIKISSKLEETDVKLDEFIAQVKAIRSEDPKKKILIFSFFADTIKYLEKKILSADIGLDSANTAFVSGRNRGDAQSAAERFAPMGKQVDIAKEDELTYLFSTDVLAEGQNLQDCGVIINYDLHWNPVRMIQRNGRINRVGTTHAEVNVINMKPHEDLDRFLKLFKSLQDKIELINATIGSDASVLGEIENPLDYTGVYDTDETKATLEYKKLEESMESFTDDQFINDLKNFLKNATPTEKETLKYIPVGKWGQLMSPDGKKTIHLVEAKFDNDQKVKAFLYSTSADAMDILLQGEALKLIKSDNRDRVRLQNPLDLETFSTRLSVVGRQLVKFEATPDTSVRASEQKVSDLALNVYSWSALEVSRLNDFYRTRNVLQSKELNKIVLKINAAARNNQMHNTYFADLRKMLPIEREATPRCVEIKELLNLLQKDLWKS